MLDKPPDRWKLWLIAQIVIIFVTGLLIGFIIGATKREVKEQLPNQYEIVPDTMIIYNGNTLAQNLGIVKTEKDKVLEAIAFCESSNNPRAYNRKSGAKGLFQIIPSSERFCEKGLGRELDMFDPDDNRLCAEYLMEHGGLSHWKASYHCWSGIAYK